MSALAAAELGRLAQLWEAERVAAREEAREERSRLTLAASAPVSRCACGPSKKLGPSNSRA
jgi:hypothetical protein